MNSNGAPPEAVGMSLGGIAVLVGLIGSAQPMQKRAQSRMAATVVVTFIVRPI